MNSRELKAAFVFRSPVRSDEKAHPVRKGHIIEVIYSLSDSGKRQCAGVLQPWAAKKDPVQIPCRHIHFAEQEPKYKPAEKTTDEHTESIKEAFLNVQPVVVDVPNVKTVRGNIKQIVYWRNRSGSIKCSADVIDVSCPHSIVRARLKYIYTDEEYQKKKAAEGGASTAKGQK